MRVVEVRTGMHYAYRSAGSGRPSRVEVTKAPSGSVVEVFVHIARGPRAHGDRRLLPGATAEVPLPQLIATWEDWLNSAEGAVDRSLPPGSPELLPDRQLHARPDRVPNPDRPLPTSYTSLGPLSRRTTSVADLPDHAAAQLEARPEALLRWCTGLPVGVVRDLAAAAVRRGMPSPNGSVGTALARSGTLLAALLARHGDLIDCFPTVGADDVAFTAAHTPSAKSVPWEPLLPEQAYEQWGRFLSGRPPGWLRVGMRADDGGFHRPSCRQAHTSFATGPLWRALLAGPRPCRECGGAGLVPHASLLAFIAASDVWHARGRGGVGERWQQEAVAGVLAFASSEQQRSRLSDHSDVLAQLLALPPMPGSPAVSGEARELLEASAAWRRMDEVRKASVMAGVEHRLRLVAGTLGAAIDAGGESEDRADTARRLRRSAQALAVRAAVPLPTLAAIIFGP